MELNSKKNINKWLKDGEYKKIINYYKKNDLSFCLELPFIKDNIEFVERSIKCQRCGNCCTLLESKGEIKHIRLIDNDLKRIAKRLGLKERTIQENYCIKVKGLWYLKTPCHFHTQFSIDINQDCRIYGDRPTSCRMFPLQNPKLMDFEGLKFLAITLSPHCPAVKNFLTKQWFPELNKYQKLIQEQLKVMKKNELDK
jgi:Fe-S-cluster containining protein